MLAMMQAEMQQRATAADAAAAGGDRYNAAGELGPPPTKKPPPPPVAPRKPSVEGHFNCRYFVVVVVLNYDVIVVAPVVSVVFVPRAGSGVV